MADVIDYGISTIQHQFDFAITIWWGLSNRVSNVVKVSQLKFRDIHAWHLTGTFWLVEGTTSIPHQKGF